MVNGFVKEKTRYMKEDKNGKLIPSNWINKKPDDDWYDYKNKKWGKSKNRNPLHFFIKDITINIVFADNITLAVKY